MKKDESYKKFTSEQTPIGVLDNIANFLLDDAATHALSFQRTVELNASKGIQGNVFFIYMHPINTPIARNSIPYTPVPVANFLKNPEAVPTDIYKMLTSTDYSKNIVFVLGYPVVGTYIWYYKVANIEESKNLPAPGDKYTTCRLVSQSNLQKQPEQYINPSCANFGCTNHPMLRCSKCLKVKYCSVACQKTDWADHKPVCFTAPPPENRNNLSPK